MAMPPGNMSASGDAAGMPDLLKGMSDAAAPEKAPDEKVAVARDLMAAQKSGDATAYAAAFKEMYDLCAAAKPIEYEGGEDEEA